MVLEPQVVIVIHISMQIIQRHRGRNRMRETQIHPQHYEIVFHLTHESRLSYTYNARREHLSGNLDTREEFYAELV